jgi:hypothetical protein
MSSTWFSEVAGIFQTFAAKFVESEAFSTVSATIAQHF